MVRSPMLVVGIDDYQRIVFQDNTFLAPYANNVSIGKNTFISPDVQIGMPGKPMDRFLVGDNCRIFAGQIAPSTFVCGDYVTIHQGVWCYGRGPAIIGHNSWFGMRCTLDAEGAFYVGNGFGAGQDTHLWSHIRHGDTLQGCEYLSFGSFRAEDDVWFVGRCTSAPASHKAFSVALTESNVTKGMEYNHVYGGNPAKDLTERIGTPYKFRSEEELKNLFAARVMDFIKQNPNIEAKQVLEVTETFDPVKRIYQKTNSQVEIAFMRSILPEAKFVPEGQKYVAW